LVREVVRVEGHVLFQRLLRLLDDLVALFGEQRLELFEMGLVHSNAPLRPTAKHTSGGPRMGTVFTEPHAALLFAGGGTVRPPRAIVNGAFARSSLVFLVSLSLGCLWACLWGGRRISDWSPLLRRAQAG